MSTLATEPTGTGSAQAAPRAAKTELVARLLPCAVLISLWLAVIPPSGGYFPRSWYPAALGSVLFFYVLRLGGRATFAAGRPLRWALVLFAVLVGWAFFSVLWAGSPGSAWEASNKLLLVLAMAGIVSVVAWTPGSLALLLGAWSLGVAVLCAGRLLTWLAADDLSRFFEAASARMSDPLGYPNATAALPAMAMVPALLLSALREVPVWVRAAALPVAVFLLEFALFAQSRGALVGGVVALAVLVALAGERMRILVRLGVVVALAAPAVRPVLDVGNAALEGRSAIGPLHDAAPVILLTVGLAAVAGGLLALADERLRIPARVVRGTAVAGAIVLLLVGAGAAVAYGGRVRTWAHDAWAAGTAPTGESSRLLSLAPEERPDYAHVSLKMFREHPLAGAGSGNFGREYDANRRFEKHSRYAHDIWLRILGELGIVGIALFLGLVGALAVGVIVRRRAQGPLERSLAAGCFAVGAYFLAHGSLDWLEEFPALAMPAVALPFAALSLGPPRPRVPLSRPALAVALLALGAVVSSLVPSWLAVRYLDRAQGERATNPAAAFADIDRARKLNNVSIDADVAEGALALGEGDEPRARRAFARAIDREPNWFSYLELGLMDARAGRFESARNLVEKAAALDANDPVIAAAREVIARRERVDPAAVNEKALDNPLFSKLNMP